MGLFDVTFSLIIDRVLPSFRQLPKWMDWEHSLVQPLQTDQSNLLTSAEFIGVGDSSGTAISNMVGAGDIPRIGMRVVGPFIVPGTTVVSVTAVNAITISNPVISNGSAQPILVTSFVNQLIRQQLYNACTLTLEAALNFTFFTTFRQPSDLPTRSDIYIDNQFPLFRPNFFFTETEATPVYLYTETEATPVYFSGEGEGPPFGFIVYVPTAKSALIPQIKGFVNKYKFAGTTFTTQTY